MEKPFVYGMSVEGENFTDRKKETERLKKDFTHGINVILISPRRIGKTSLVKKVSSEIADPHIKVVFMDIYDCRSEYDFYNRFAVALVKQTASLGITPKEYTPQEILNLPEVIAKEKGLHLVVCIDEFQQIGEFPDSLNVQKRMRGVWQHQQNVSYCLFGSKKHLMTKLFQNRRMPFFQFGEMNELHKISTADWIPFIVSRFGSNHQIISEEQARKICEQVENYSSYVQQLSWNVMAEAGERVTDEDLKSGFEALLAQNASFFTEQTRGLSSYQLNFIRALCNGYHSEFSSKKVADAFPMGTKSNISRIKAALLDREIIDEDRYGVFLADPIFKYWFIREFG